MTHVPWHPDENEKLAELHGVESVELLSVGIDIGTTTTQLMFSRMVARRQGGDYASKFQIVEREQVYESPIILTPYEEGNSIDTDEIDAFLDRVYEDAGYRPDDVDTGAVIITGEACRTENADPIVELFSEQSGRFVCSTAGANLEALMAAHGSGAVDYSLETNQDVLHVDVGGGTTKLAHIVDGFVQDTVSINVGARLVAFDDDGNVTRLEDAARTVAADIDLPLERGESLSTEGRDRLATRFAELLRSVIEGELTPLARTLLVTDPPDDAFSFDVVTFSGGGAEYIYDREPGYYNDLGPEFGAAIREEIEARTYSVAELDTGIRATAVGSTQHAVQVSGNTITITDETLLPLRNVPMIPFVAHADDDADELAREVAHKLDLYDVEAVDGAFALGFHLHGLPEYEFLRTITEAAIDGWRSHDPEQPLILAFDSDVAMNVGRLATERISQPVIAVDGVELDQFGYIDIGEPLEDTNAVPLTIKSLVFEG